MATDSLLVSAGDSARGSINDSSFGTSEQTPGILGSRPYSGVSDSCKPVDHVDKIIKRPTPALPSAYSSSDIPHPVSDPYRSFSSDPNDKSAASIRQAAPNVDVESSYNVAPYTLDRKSNRSSHIRHPSGTQPGNAAAMPAPLPPQVVNTKTETISNLVKPTAEAPHIQIAAPAQARMSPAAAVSYDTGISVEARRCVCMGCSSPVSLVATDNHPVSRAVAAENVTVSIARSTQAPTAVLGQSISTGATTIGFIPSSCMGPEPYLDVRSAPLKLQRIDNTLSTTSHGLGLHVSPSTPLPAPHGGISRVPSAASESEQPSARWMTAKHESAAALVMSNTPLSVCNVEVIVHTDVSLRQALSVTQVILILCDKFSNGLVNLGVELRVYIVSSVIARMSLDFDGAYFMDSFHACRICNKLKSSSTYMIMCYFAIVSAMQ